jgi:hypothetical protein
MNKIAYTKIGQLGAGFTNQIYTLITNIILSQSWDGKKILIVDKFYNDYVTENNGICISKIFDINGINEYLSKKYDIIILSKYDIDFKIKCAIYGFGNNSHDVTDKIINLFYKENTLHIPKNINMNELNGNPLPGIKKQFTIIYSLNNHNFVEVFDEILRDDIIFNLENQHFRCIFGWPNRYNRKMFDDILCNIHYHSKYTDISKNFLQNIDNDKLNVLHLRLEDDAIEHWSKKNNMNEPDFENYIMNKYIEIISTHIDKNDKNIILSYSTDNKVITFLKNNGYDYTFIEKNNEGREINALIDFLISNGCNNVFIGNYHPEKINGSTFSYYISKKLEPNVKQILIDLENIQDKENIINNVI